MQACCVACEGVVTDATSGASCTPTHKHLAIESAPPNLHTANNPLLKNPNDAYHPIWTLCGPLTVAEGTIDEGALNSTSCTGSKRSDDSAVRVTFNGNLRVTDCHDCCVRWFVTLNGEECTDPAPIEAVVYSADAEQVNIHRSSTITGEYLQTSMHAWEWSALECACWLAVSCCHTLCLEIMISSISITSTIRMAPQGSRSQLHNVRM